MEVQKLIESLRICSDSMDFLRLTDCLRRKNDINTSFDNQFDNSFRSHRIMCLAQEN